MNLNESRQNGESGLNPGRIKNARVGISDSISQAPTTSHSNNINSSGSNNNSFTNQKATLSSVTKALIPQNKKKVSDFLERF